MLSRRLCITSLAALLAACGSGSSSTTAGSTGSAPTTATASASAPAPTASAEPPDAATSAATLPTAAPTASATATTTASAALHDAGAPKPKPTAALDAGAKDAGSVAVADAGAASPATLAAQQVDAIFAGKKTFSARFKQQYTQKITGTVKDSTGVVFVERPNKVSFRYDAPNKNRIVSDGTSIKVYIAEDNQMFETPVGKTQYPGALAFMMGNGITSSFSFAIKNAAGYSGTVLEGTPLTPNPSYETVLFYVGQQKLAAKDAGAIERVLILDATGNKNRFDFEGASQPATIDAAEFTFTPPPGTDIKRQ